ncbi:primase C-terminal domain-containing protein [Corynebacterium propinquum]|uniref:primase C-terminal domain-containing protein n=1 Tax=Corynebacterium propinquum TaxID=43769 RepID=UPI0032B1D0DF
MFESARTWAYREISYHFGDPQGLGRIIQEEAQLLNQTQFETPLPVAEVDHIARSIHKWIITKSRMWADGPASYDATFTPIPKAHVARGAGRLERLQPLNALRKRNAC